MIEFVASDTAVRCRCSLVAWDCNSAMHLLLHRRNVPLQRQEGVAAGRKVGMLG